MRKNLENGKIISHPKRGEVVRGGEDGGTVLNFHQSDILVRKKSGIFSSKRGESINTKRCKNHRARALVPTLSVSFIFYFLFII